MCMSCIIEEITGLDLSTQEAHDELQAMKERGERINWPAVTDEMKEAAAYIEALHANPAGGTGGPLHILVDDNNVDDDSLEHCRKNIDRWDAWDGSDKHELQCKALSLWILDLMDPMSVAERQVTIGLADRMLAEVHGRVYMPATEFPIRERIEDAEGNYVGTQWGFRLRRVDADLGQATP